jgi:hypothetical protein
VPCGPTRLKRRPARRLLPEARSDRSPGLRAP